MLGQYSGAFSGSYGDGYGMANLSGDYLSFTTGSKGDGYTLNTWSGNSLLAFTGGSADGYTYSLYSASSLLTYRGINSDGYTMSNVSSLQLRAFFASTGDGYHKTRIQSAPLLSFTGTHKDGYSKINLLSPPLLATFGSQGDGYDLGMSCRTITWRGLTGTGWNIANNWQDQLIPCHCNPIIVPNQATNFPNVNAGLLRVGGEDDSADFNCKRILVEQGAQLITRVNCFVENLDWIVIRGLMEIRNPTQGALINYGNIDIKGSGTVQFKP